MKPSLLLLFCFCLLSSFCLVQTADLRSIIPIQKFPVQKLVPEVVIVEENVISENVTQELPAEGIQALPVEVSVDIQTIQEVELVEVAAPEYVSRNSNSEITKLLVLVDTTLIDRSIIAKQEVSNAYAEILSQQLVNHLSKSDSVHTCFVWFNSGPEARSSEWLALGPSFPSYNRENMQRFINEGIVFLDNSVETATTSNWEAGFIEVRKRLMQYKNEYSESNFRVLFLAASDPAENTYINVLRNVNDMKKTLDNMRVISVALSDGVSPSLIQTLSGYHPQQDFYILENAREQMASENYKSSTSFVTLTLRHLLNQGVCGESVQDQCRTCYGDDSSCKGCDGMIKSFASYDVCGVCNGNADSCGRPSPITQQKSTATSESVRFRTWVEKKNSRTINMEVNWNHLPFSLSERDYEVVLTFEPFSSPCQLQQEYPPSECEYVVALGKQNSSDSVWQKKSVSDDSWVYTFELSYDDLFTKCQNTHGYFKSQDRPDIGSGVIDLSGSIFLNAISYSRSSNEDCTLDVLSSTHFDFTIQTATKQKMFMNANVKSEIPYEYSVSDFQRVDLLSGDIAFYFNTTITQGFVMADGHIVKPKEKGSVPFQLFAVDAQNNVLGTDFDVGLHIIDKTAEGMHVQRWVIRTFGALGVKKFENIAPIAFSIFKAPFLAPKLEEAVVEGEETAVAEVVQPSYSLYPVSRVSVVYDFVIEKHSDPKLDNQLRPWLQMETMKEIDSVSLSENGTVPEITKEVVVEYNPTIVLNEDKVIFRLGSSPLIKHSGLRMVLDRVFYCGSKFGDLLPYDVSKPEYTGCATPIRNVVQNMVYNRFFNETSQQFEEVSFQDFTWVSDDSGSIAFSVMAVRLSPYSHIIQAHYHLEPVEQEENENEISVELVPMEESQDEVVYTAISNHQKLIDQKLYYQSYPFAYSRKVYFEPLGVDVVARHPQIYNSVHPVHPFKAKTEELKRKHEEFMADKLAFLADPNNLAQLGEIQNFHDSYWSWGSSSSSTSTLLSSTYSLTSTNSTSNTTTSTSSSSSSSVYEELISYLLGGSSNIVEGDDDDGTIIIVDDDSDDDDHHHHHHHHHGDHHGSHCHPTHWHDHHYKTKVCHYHNHHFFDNDPAQTVGQSQFQVVCTGGYWRSGECIRYVWGNWFTSRWIAIWALIIFFLVLLIVFACCWCGSPEDSEYTIPPNFRRAVVGSSTTSASVEVGPNTEYVYEARGHGNAVHRNNTVVVKSVEQPIGQRIPSLNTPVLNFRINLGEFINQREGSANDV